MQKSYPYTLYQWVWKLIDWIYPPFCGGCGKAGARWCEDCQNSLQRIRGLLCQRCGLPLTPRGVCVSCQQQPFILDGLRAYAQYAGTLRNAIQRLKYHRDIALAEVFAAFLVELYQETEWELEQVVAVPLGVVRKRERGYNQAALIAFPFSIAVNVPYSGRSLYRIRETRSQVELGYRQRLENVKEAFWADPRFVNGKNILIIDDVTTTAATLNACAEALKIAGAKSVFGLVVARAILLEGG